jgi:hypothetical protein
LAYSGLLGFAPVIEVGENAPFLQRLNLLNDGMVNLLRNLKESIPPARCISKDDQEESGRLAAPIADMSVRRRNSPCFH